MTVTKTTLAAALSATAFVGASQAGLVAHWSFDNDFTDTTGNHNGSTSTGASITSTAGEVKFGSGALNINPNGNALQNVVIASPISFGSGDAWSVAFWGKTSTATAPSFPGIAIGEHGSDQNYIWYRTDADNYIRLQFDGSGSGNRLDKNFSPSLAGNTDYHHVVVTYDGAGTVTFYQDGVSLGTGSKTLAFDNINSIGAAYKTADEKYNFNGQLDEVYIFDEAIGQATVTSLFTSNQVPEPSSLALIGLGGLAILRRRR